MTDEQREAPQWPAQEGAPAWVAPGQDAISGAPPVAPLPPPAPAARASQMPPPVAAAPTFRSWQPGIIPLRPLSFGDFLAVPFKAMRFNRTVVVGAPLLFTLVSTVLMVVAMWMLFNDPQLSLLNIYGTPEGIAGTTVAVIVVAVLTAFLADVLSSSIIAPGVARAVMGERITIAVAWRQVRRRLGSLLLLYLVAGAVMLVAILAMLIPFLLAALGDSAGAGGAALLSVAALFLLVIPAGVAIVLLQGVARAMIVLEGISFGAAMRRMFGLIKGRFWWGMLVVFVSGLLIYVVSMIFQYVGQFASLGVLFAGPEADGIMMVVFFAIYGLSTLVSTVLVYAYLGCVFSLFYIDLRMRHEGFDLDLARAAEARAMR